MADKQSREECVGGTTIQEQYAEILKRKKAGELTVKIDVDVSEALTGLKAIQREAREATKVLRELEEAKKRSQALPSTRIGGGGGTISSASEGYSNKGRQSDYKAHYEEKSVTDDIRRSYE